mmetsp:Transcript_15079/g.24495  ORF Transcript_15079/g.24495 Transcript_15079/m.24495 type:complete len:230 (+) Transcript_15079:1309-1998(+)
MGNRSFSSRDTLAINDRCGRSDRFRYTTSTHGTKAGRKRLGRRESAATHSIHILKHTCEWITSSPARSSSMDTRHIRRKEVIRKKRVHSPSAKKTSRTKIVSKKLFKQIPSMRHTRAIHTSVMTPSATIKTCAPKPVICSTLLRIREYFIRFRHQLKFLFSLLTILRVLIWVVFHSKTLVRSAYLVGCSIARYLENGIVANITPLHSSNLIYATHPPINNATFHSNSSN